MFLVDIKPDVEFIFHCGVFDSCVAFAPAVAGVPHSRDLSPPHSQGRLSVYGFNDSFRTISFRSVRADRPSRAARGNRTANTPHLFQDRVHCFSTSPQPQSLGKRNRQSEYSTYCIHMKIFAADPLSDFRLRLRFADGTDRVVDLSDLAGVGVFQAWLEPGVFEQVTVTNYGSLAWPDELDLCPDSLYLRATGKEPEDIFPSLKHSLAHA
jgi:hypothetical protein